MAACRPSAGECRRRHHYEARWVGVHVVMGCGSEGGLGFDTALRAYSPAAVAALRAGRGRPDAGGSGKGIFPGPPTWRVLRR